LLIINTQLSIWITQLEQDTGISADQLWNIAADRW